MNQKIIVLLSLLAFTIFPSSVQAQDPNPSEPDSGSVVCEPGVYLAKPDDCLPLGPSAYLTQLAQAGLTIPPRPLPASKPDPSLTHLPYFYFHCPILVGFLAKVRVWEKFPLSRDWNSLRRRAIHLGGLSSKYRL
jgi:hypothetical protein